MPDGCVPLLIVIVILIILSGLFSATETAYSCLNKVKVKSMANGGDKRAKKVLALSEKYESLITTILIGNNIVNLSAASIAGVFFALLAIEGIDSNVLSTAVLTVAILIFGEITPKFLAKSSPEKFAFSIYPIITFFYYILLPLNFIFSLYQKLVAKLFKLKKEESITDEELMTIVDEAEEDGVLEEDESELVRSALEFGDSEAGDILVPRVKIVAVALDSKMEAIRAKFNESGFSRLVVYNESIDDVIGFIHEKDFYNLYLNGGTEVSSIINKLVGTSEHTKIHDLLKTMQYSKSQLAAVYDEYGGILGIISIEDILEELVGEIWDEHDDKVELINKVSEDCYRIDGDCDIDTFFDDLNVKSETTDEIKSNTVGGWITEKYEGIPKEGECFDIDNLHVEVVKASDKKILEVQVIVTEEEDEEEKSDKKEDKKSEDKKEKDKDKDDKKSDSESVVSIIEKIKEKIKD